MELEDLPILGEPLAVELANTRYGAGANAIDFLGDRALVRLWLSVALPDGGSIAQRDHADLLALRDAVHQLCEAAVDARPPAASAVSVVNELLERAEPRPQLRVTEGRLDWELRFAGTASRRHLGRLAHAVAQWLAGDDLSLLRRCPGPGCTMFFVQRHHRRRFCHSSCSHRARQAAYYRRQRGQGTE